MRCLLCVGLACLIFAQPVLADAKEWRKEKLKEIDAEIKAIEARIKKTQANLKEAASQLPQREKDLADARETAENARQPVKDAAQALKEAGEASEQEAQTSDPELASLNERVKQAQTKYDAAAAPVLAALREQPDYQMAANKLASSQRWLAQLREHPDPDFQAANVPAASREVMEAQAQVRLLETQALADHEEVTSARQALDDATAAVVDYRKRKIEDGSVAGDEDRLAQLRKNYYDAQKALQESTKRRNDAEAEFQRFKQAGQSLEQSIADDKALIESKKRERKKYEEKK